MISLYACVVALKASRSSSPSCSSVLLSLPGSVDRGWPLVSSVVRCSPHWSVSVDFDLAICVSYVSLALTSEAEPSIAWNYSYLALHNPELLHLELLVASDEERITKYYQVLWPSQWDEGLFLNWTGPFLITFCSSRPLAFKWLFKCLLQLKPFVFCLTPASVSSSPEMTWQMQYHIHYFPLAPLYHWH